MSYRPEDTNILDICNVDIDTFYVFTNKYNQVVDHLRNTVVTISNTSAYQGNNTGNGYVTGIFGGNTIVVGDTLRGGNVTSSANLNISTWTIISNNLTVSANVLVNGHSNVNTVLARGAVLVNNTATVSGNVLANTNLTVVGNTTTGEFHNIGPDFVSQNIAVASLGATVGSAIPFVSWPKAAYTSAKFLIQTKSGANSQVYEAIATHNNTTPLMAVYGVIASPSGANTGVLTMTSNTTHIIANYTQTAINTSLKALIHFVR